MRLCPVSHAAAAVLKACDDCTAAAAIASQLALPPLLCATLRADVVKTAAAMLAASSSDSSTVTTAAAATTAAASVDREWSALVAVFEQLLPAAAGVGSSKKRSSLQQQQQPTSAWASLLGSAYHAQQCSVDPSLLISLSCLGGTQTDTAALAAETQQQQAEQQLLTTPEVFVQYALPVVKALCLLHEDMRVSSFTAGVECSRVAELVSYLATTLASTTADVNIAAAASAIAMHYDTAVPQQQQQQQQITDGDSMAVDAIEDSPPCVYSTMLSHITGSSNSSSSSSSSNCATWGWPHTDSTTTAAAAVTASTATALIAARTGHSAAAKLCRFHSILSRATTAAAGDAAAVSVSQQRSTQLVAAMVEEGFTSEDLTCVPLGLAVPLIEVLEQCRQDPPLGWPYQAYQLLKRQDVAAMNRMRALTAASSSSSSSSSSTTLSLQSAVSSTISDAPTSSYTDDEGDGLVQAEAAALLRLDRAPEVTDHEYAARQQARLLLLCERMLAAAPARGMLTLGQCLPSLLQDPLPLAIPPLCLAGRATPGGVIVALNTTAADVAADLTHWPEFHNGVAAGLRLAAAGGSVPCMTRSWVLYNRGTTSGASGSGSSSSSKSHDGFLLALGLQRHLQALTGHDISRYLEQRSDGTQGPFRTVGCLLGLAADRR
eukprot:18025-Heterococcus_DN1.PRE.1